jgi:hypothetical protein
LRIVPIITSPMIHHRIFIILPIRIARLSRVRRAPLPGSIA